MPDLKNLLTEAFDEHQSVIAATLADEANVLTPLTQLAELCYTAVTNGNKLIFMGNGGSASDAAHLATEIIARLRRNRQPLPAITLPQSMASVTAIGNDFGYDELFARELEAVAQPGDITIALTTSGHSKNILQAANMAQAMDLTFAAFCGNNGGDLKGKATPLIIIPSQNTARIQETYMLLGHLLCRYVEDRFIEENGETAAWVAA